MIVMINMTVRWSLIKGLNDVNIAEEAQANGNATRELTIRLINETVTRIEDEVENQKESIQLAEEQGRVAHPLIQQSIDLKERHIGGAKRSIQEVVG